MNLLVDVKTPAGAGGSLINISLELNPFPDYFPSESNIVGNLKYKKELCLDEFS